VRRIWGDLQNVGVGQVLVWGTGGKNRKERFQSSGSGQKLCWKGEKEIAWKTRGKKIPLIGTRAIGKGRRRVMCFLRKGIQ